LDIPALIIEADNDPLVDENFRELLKSTYPLIPFKTFHQKGHFPYLNAPDEYNRTLDPFLSDN
jgi:pimeloyl-ACP methyl ester carboxylesterase